MQDKARTKTDKQLNKMERDMGRVYKTYPALLKVEKEYRAYMDMVSKETKAAYDAYVNGSDEDKKELKKAYTDEVKALTINSDDYHKIVKKFVRVMAEVNQKALDIVNKEMRTIYAENYNQVAEECRRVGIKVNGKE